MGQIHGYARPDHHKETRHNGFHGIILLLPYPVVVDVAAGGGGGREKIMGVLILGM